MTPEALAALAGWDIDVEAHQRLSRFVGLVERWTNKINLIAPTPTDQIWQRHVADCAQLLPYIPRDARRLVDLGSGGGFPGVILAILTEGRQPLPEIILIESDGRKAAFLRTAAATLSLQVRIEAARAEAILPLSADVVTARALAPLGTLMPLVLRHLAPEGVGILPKGRHYRIELAGSDTAGLSIRSEPSRTDPEAAILLIGRARDGRD
jgi:16S rRNA (guanine527-N7)-methyltransferase